jgi:hypothetical protein
MTRDDIIRMARKADPGFETDTFHAESLVGMEAIERFAALVAAAAVRETSAEYRLGWNDGAMMEREECAKLIEDMAVQHPKYIAAAIRARGKE